MALPTHPPFAARLSVLALLVASGAAGDATGGDVTYLNVYGEALQSCSSDGMALTGYTRSGSCVETQDDSGSHHICIDLSSLGGNDGGGNFCDVTGKTYVCRGLCGLWRTRGKRRSSCAVP